MILKKNLSFDFIDFDKYTNLIQKIKKQIDSIDNKYNITKPELYNAVFYAVYMNNVHSGTKLSLNFTFMIVRLMITEIYAFSRMFRSFELLEDSNKINRMCPSNTSQNNIIYFGGHSHVLNIYKILILLFGKNTSIFEKIITDDDLDRNRQLSIPKQHLEFKLPNPELI